MVSTAAAAAAAAAAAVAADHFNEKILDSESWKILFEDSQKIERILLFVNLHERGASITFNGQHRKKNKIDFL